MMFTDLIYFLLLLPNSTNNKKKLSVQHAPQKTFKKKLSLYNCFATCCSASLYVSNRFAV